MTTIKPWVNAPLELIRHAEGHLEGGSDLDKRMALISYDNAIEVAVKTYLELHPVQRGGRTYERRQIERWKQNYHTQLEFLEEYVGQVGRSMEITRDEIIWYHQRRNHLYHAGDGLVPAEYDLQGIRKVALWVLSVLFDVNAEALLSVASVSPPKPVPEEEQQPPSEMVLIRSYMDFERVLQAVANALGLGKDSQQPFRARDVWQRISPRLAELPASADEIVTRATAARNSIVHGRPSGFSEEVLMDLSAQLDGISDYLGQVRHEAGRPTAQPIDRQQPVLDQVRRILGPEAMDRLEGFLRKMRALEIRMHKRSQSLSYRLKSPRARYNVTASQQKKWTVFLLTPHEHEAWLAFPDWHWRQCMPFGIEPYLQRLRALGCVDYQKPKETELRLYLGEHNSLETFDRLEGVVRDLVAEMDTALTAGEGMKDRQLPAPFQAPLEQLRREVGDSAADGLGRFLAYVSDLPVMAARRKDSFSFRAWAWRRMQEGDDPKRTLTTVFSLGIKPGDARLSFPIFGHWRWIVGFDHRPFIARLKALGFVEGQADLRHQLRSRDSTEMFEQLSIVVRDVVAAMEETLAAQQDIVLRESDDPLQAMLAQVRRDVGAEAAERLGAFLDHALSLDLKLDPQKTMIAFRTLALRRPDKNRKQARVLTVVFYLGSRARGPCLMFPMKWQWSRVEGLDADSYVARLRALGCIEAPTGADLRLYLQDHNDAEVFDRLYAIVQDVSADMVASVRIEGEKK